MSGDEALYRQYLSGDDTGLEALMKQYGDPLTMYIDGYLHDARRFRLSFHKEAEDPGWRL